MAPAVSGYHPADWHQTRRRYDTRNRLGWRVPFKGDTCWLAQRQTPDRGRHRNSGMAKCIVRRATTPGLNPQYHYDIVAARELSWRRRGSSYDGSAWPYADRRSGVTGAAPLRAGATCKQYP